MGSNSKVSAERKIELSLQLVSKMFPRQPEVKVDVNLEQKIDILTIARKVDGNSHKGRDQVIEALSEES